MIHAYNEIYLDDAMRNLGECFDYSFCDCGIAPDEFLNLFISSGIADQFGDGNPKYVCGMSGSELAIEVINTSGLTMEYSNPITRYDYTPEYWSGWVLAYYQWKSGRTFGDISKTLRMTDILKLYPTLHEASEEKFVDTVNAIIRQSKLPSKLQIQRKKCNYSQSMLSKKSGVNIRTLQQYELRTKDISKASVLTVMNLARALGCKIEDIIEYPLDD